MARNLSNHPCFDASARHRSARIHLPVAPDCNVQCNFCKRKYDCANESRPGVTSAVLSPSQALFYLERMLRRDPRIAVVGIAGPGDPFALPERTLETLRLVRRRFPEMLLCVASNGLSLAPYVDQLAELEVSHVTLTVNAVDPEIAGRLYAWVRDGKRICRGRAAGEVLWQRQAEAIGRLKTRGVTVKINTIVVPGINEQHVVEVARQTSALGADILNCVPLYPVEDTPFGTISPPSSATVASIRAAAGQYLSMVEHCTRCRADAVGLLGEPMPAWAVRGLLEAASLPLVSGQQRPYVAVATLDGVLVNQHLGEARELAIFRQTESGFDLVEMRSTPPSGGGTQRWETLAKTLGDCQALLVSGAGASPCSVLGARGIRVVLMEGLIEEGLQAIYRGAEIRAPCARQHRCGSGCSGNGLGCG
jgi:nitrogen fixation protein NifB